MLRLTVRHDTAGTRGYYRPGAGGECPAGPDGRTAGEWGGRAAAALGLAGTADPPAFAALCGNRHPRTGEPLTPRTRADRRAGWDLGFHPPKSVSVVHGLTGDPRVLAAFAAAVRATLAELEGDARTRVRAGGRDDLRATGNLAWALFLHATARPVDGIPDPHLHAHAVLFNLTRDPAEGQWKAAELSGVYRDIGYHQAAFHARLAHTLAGHGFAVERTPFGWELGGIPASVRRAFSRRTAEVERAARALGVTDPAVKARLGARTRAAKRLGFTPDDLRTVWALRLPAADRAAVRAAVPPPGLLTSVRADTGREWVTAALRQCFSRAAVVPVRQALAVALRAGVGVVTPERVRQTLAGRGLITRECRGEWVATTADLLTAEAQAVRFARDGRCACPPLGRGLAEPSSGLPPPERAAVRHVLRSTDRVTIVPAGWGGGITGVADACVRALTARGYEVIRMSPPVEVGAGWVSGDRRSGAGTGDQAGPEPRAQTATPNPVLWADRAETLGPVALAALARLAEGVSARVVLAAAGRSGRPADRWSPLSVLCEHTRPGRLEWGRWAGRSAGRAHTPGGPVDETSPEATSRTGLAGRAARSAIAETRSRHHWEARRRSASWAGIEGGPPVWPSPARPGHPSPRPTP
ncbi:MAG: MobF family relaxase [Gemmataceae bacterium]